VVVSEMRSHDRSRVSRGRQKRASIYCTRPIQLSPMSKSTTKQGTKRKSQSALPDARSAKQPKLTIDSFFSRKVSVRIGSGLDSVAADAEEKVLDVVLSDEQVKVLRMVVEEGKNVFFTGSAGTFLPLPFFCPLFFPLVFSFHAKGNELIVIPLAC
jgi:hypothetical protein